MINATKAARIYTETIANLRGLIETHEGADYAVDRNGDKILGVSAFARQYGLDRANISKILNGQREMSVGLYQRIAVALGLLDARSLCDEAVLQNLSLKTYLLIDVNAIKDSILMVAFGEIND